MPPPPPPSSLNVESLVAELSLLRQQVTPTATPSRVLAISAAAASAALTVIAFVIVTLVIVTLQLQVEHLVHRQTVLETENQSLHMQLTAHNSPPRQHVASR